MKCPFATWIGSPNYGYPRGTHGQLQPLAICDHIMAGTLAGCDSWFNNPWTVSSHFGIGKNGDIHQYVDTDDCAWANGSVANPDPALAYIYENYNPNVVTWSIEHEGYPNDLWTEAMYQASLKLKRWLLQQEPGLALVGHYQFDSVNKNNCPGPHWPKRRLIADLEEPMVEDQFAQFRNAEMRFMNLADSCHGITLACQMRVISAIRHNWGESTDEEMQCWSNLAGAYRAEIDAIYKALERCSWLGRPG